MAKPKLPKGGNRPAAAAAKQKPTQPVQTDKFGLFLLLIVFLMLIGNFVVWEMVAVGVDRQMLMAEDPALYPRDGTILAYESAGSLAGDRDDQGTGSLTSEPGQVDIVVINKGSADGIRVGDVFVPKSMEGLNEAHIEFDVIDVSPTQCRAWILIGRSPAGRRQISRNLADLQAKIPVQSQVHRQLGNQTVRNVLKRPAQ